MAVNTIVSSAYDTSGAGGRKMVKLSNGWLVSMAYYATTPAVYWYVSKDNGQTWTQLCYANTNGSAGSAMSSSGTTVYTIVANTGATGFNIWKFDATTVINGNTGSTAVVDSGQTSFGSGVSLTIDNAGTLHAAWCSKNSTYPNSFNIRYSKSTDGGNTWAAVTQVTPFNTSGTDVTNPCIVVTSGSLPRIFYQKTVSSNNWISCIRFDGTSWTETSVYVGGTYAQNNPCAVVDSTGTIHVVWYGTDSTDTSYNNIRYSKSTDGGNTWSSMVKLTTGNSYSQVRPTITIDAKDRLYVYFDGVDSAVNATYDNIRRIIGEPQGTSWGAVKTLTNNTTGNAMYAQTPWQITYTPDRFARYMWQDNQNVGVKYSMDNNVQIAAWSAYDLSGNGGRKLVQLSNGWLVAGAIGTDSTKNINFYVSKDNGATWTIASAIGASGTASQGLALTSKGTTVYVLLSYGNSTMYSYSFDPYTNTTGSMVSIDPSQTALGNCSLTIDSVGTLHAAWVSKNSTYPNSFNIRYSKSTDGGATWATVTQMTTNNTSGQDQTNPCIVVRANNYPNIFAQGYNGSNYYISGYYWTGSSWGSYAPYNGGTYTQSNPCAVVDGAGNIHVVWTGTDATYTTNGQVKYSKSTDGGNTWSAMVNLTTNGSYLYANASIVADGANNLHVLFHGVDSSLSTGYYNVRRIVNIGGTWGSIYTLTNNTTLDAEYPSAFYANNTVLYVWQDRQNNQIRFNSYSTNSVALAGLDTSGNGGRKIVKLSNGWLVAGAIATDSTKNINFYVSKDNGATWSLLAFLSAGGTASQGLALASSGTTVYAVLSFSNSVVYAYRFDATTVTNTAGLGSVGSADTGQTSLGSGCSLVIDGTGALHAAWCSKNSAYPNSNNIRYSKSTDGGTTWASVTQVTASNTSSYDNTNPCIVVNSANTPFVFYQSLYTSNANNIAWRKFNGTDWNTNGTVYTGGATYTQYNPCAAVDSNDNIHVVWTGSDATYSTQVKYSKSSDGGSTWSSMVNLTTSPSLAQQYPSITIDGSNNLYVYWQGGDEFIAPSMFNVRTIKNTAGTWGAISTVTNNVFQNAQNPQVGWQKFNGDMSNIRVIWQDTQDGVVGYNGIALFMAMQGLVLPEPNKPNSKANIDYLRQQVNTFRTNNGLAAKTDWTDPVIIAGPTGTPVKAVHMNEIEAAINEVYTTTGQTYQSSAVQSTMVETVPSYDRRYQPQQDMLNRFQQMLKGLQNIS